MAGSSTTKVYQTSMRSSAAARPPRKPRAAPRCCRFTHSHDFTRSSAAWRTSKQPASSVRTAAGADAHAFESLLAAGQSSNAAVQDRPVASATTAAAAAAAASVDVEGTGDLLPPILPLHRGAERFAWAAPDGALLEVIVRRGVLQDDSHGGSSGAGALERPPLVFIHGLFRGAWCWDEALMPALSSAGYDCYALSLRGQGCSQLGEGMAQVARARGGVPLAVNVADIAAFIDSLEGPPPVLVGHSLGGTFVQEYLALLARQQGSQREAVAELAAGGAEPAGSGSGASGGTGGDEEDGQLLRMPPLPPLSGAVALASACAGTVMAFGDFVKDVGVREFLYQMYIVFSCAHLRDENVARYCWWSERLPQEDADVYHRAVRASSRALPYITAEIGAWAPPPVAVNDDGARREDDGAGRAAADESPVPPGGDESSASPLPPILAIGGAEDKIIRPFQVEAFEGHWGARVSVLPGVTHDAMLGGQALRVAVEMLAWLEALPCSSPSSPSPSSASFSMASQREGAEAAAAGASGEPSVRVLPLHQGLQEPGVGSEPVLGGGAAGMVSGLKAGRPVLEQRAMAL